MKAVAFRTPLPVSDERSLVDVELGTPEPTGRDLLVAVRAVSVNPVDTKVRGGAIPLDGETKVIGWDAAGIVAAVGPDVERFAVGDEVFYAGELLRAGSNAEFQLVDERLVGRKPRSIGFAEAAALPLTGITAWETLFDRLDVTHRPPAGATNTILIIGGGGGVASIAVQLAKARTDLTVIGTASRPETRDWVRAQGADHVIDHSKPLPEQIAALGLGAPAYVFSTTHTDSHLAGIGELIAPQGRLALIDDPERFDVVPLKTKAISVHWELMFTRPLFRTADMGEQGRILDAIAAMVDAGQIRSTMTQNLGRIDAANLRRAHALLESGRAMGKIVLEGF
ncbi:zinc-binding alcohol dehydrogenase family protein [Aureimonas pseudogalii]|uniref:Zinc-type alcohol dehydrogenase-like protein n=1 Tax=Aureimonas pseudogalii TaxID=1744844 RepID=A0A7W6EAU2_9HYPH|nr:zinc-binding alcohol dehydrogenase family protein [Aureimonas pseudogalii]MBB3997930.1 NADPH2:quinone reductase [Aureimonas pseudogalii]